MRVVITGGAGHIGALLEVAKAFTEAGGRPIPVVVAPRRVGDGLQPQAAPSRAAKEPGRRAALRATAQPIIRKGEDRPPMTATLVPRPLLVGSI